MDVGKQDAAIQFTTYCSLVKKLPEPSLLHRRAVLSFLLKKLLRTTIECSRRLFTTRGARVVSRCAEKLASEKRKIGKMEPFMSSSEKFLLQNFSKVDTNCSKSSFFHFPGC